MRIVFTAAALADLDEILNHTASTYPGLVFPLQRRIHAVLDRIAAWPECGCAVGQRPGVRMVPLIRYPFRLFYRVEGDTIEVLHVHHVARDDP